jgi:hypothetical protein
MPRFVILEHDHPEPHWDFLLEDGPMLRAWRLATPPAPGQEIQAEANCDHRLFYLDYEGPVSGGRGSVKRFETGDFELDYQSEDRLAICLRGHRLRCRAVLERREGASWRCCFGPPL